MFLVIDWQLGIAFWSPDTKSWLSADPILLLPCFLACLTMALGGIDAIKPN
jgi:hypothetical protein